MVPICYKEVICSITGPRDSIIVSALILVKQYLFFNFNEDEPNLALGKLWVNFVVWILFLGKNIPHL